MASRRGAGIVRALVLAALALAVMFVAYRARRAFIPFAIAIAISYLIRPLVMIVESRGAQRSAAIFTAYLLVTAIIGYSLVFVLPPLATQLDEIVRVFSERNGLGNASAGAEAGPPQPQLRRDAVREGDPKAQEQAKVGLGELVHEWGKKITFLPERATTRMAEAVVVGVESYIREFAVAARRIVSVLISHLGSIMIAPVIAFYLTRDVDDIKEGFVSWLPADSRDRIMGAVSGIDEALAGWVRGQVIICAFVGVATGASLAFFGVEYALPIGVLVGILEIIPYFGPLLGMIPAVLMAAQKSTFTAIIVAVVFTLIQQVESAVLSPKIVGDCVGLHPLAVIGALLVGGALFGVVGILLAVPVSAVLFILGERLLLGAD
ncbi:MAG: AI-2E family transporter [Firmicutes bacterium]|nr:AI-2E family transporter [Bacillota bacterium]MDD4792366.1 AI-2E family transporter [Bacillota bacterium]